MSEKKTKYRGFTPAQAEAHKRYMKDFVEVKVRMKAEKRTTIQEHAAKMGESTTAFINRAIDEAMKRDKPIVEPNAAAATSTETKTNQIKPQAAEPEQTPSPERHYKPFTEDVESKINLQELLTNINLQLDVAEDYGTEVLAKLLEKARRQEDTNEQEAEAQQDTN